MPTHTLTYTHRGAGGTVSKAVQVGAENENRAVIPFAAAPLVHMHVETFIPCDTLKAITFLSDQDLLIEYNDNAGVQGHIDLVADQPLFWYEGAGWALADMMGYAAGAVNITDLYVSSVDSDMAAGTLNIMILNDATP